MDMIIVSEEIPSNPVEGLIWIRYSMEDAWQYFEGNFVPFTLEETVEPVKGLVMNQDNPPDNPSEYMIWVRYTQGDALYYFNNTWIPWVAE